ncbi:MAG: DUF1828 domain-containing protein [Thermoplasmata archaeon]
MTDCTRVLGQYLSHLEAVFSVEQDGEDCVLTTPFLNQDNDPIQVRISIRGQTVELSDMGESVGFLFLHGVELKEGSRQNWFFETTLRRLGVSAHGSEIVARAPIGDLSEALTRVTEAARSAQHIAMTAKARSKLGFADDVAGWLTSAHIEHARWRDYTGAGGKHWVFDFDLEPLSASQPRTLMYAFSSLSSGWASTLVNKAIVAFLEIRDTGLQFRSACLLDDSVEDDVWTGPIVSTLKRRADIVGFWEEKEDFLEHLTAHA